MQITDPIADMLTRIRNANNAKHDTLDVPASNMKKAIAKILLDEVQPPAPAGHAWPTPWARSRWWSPSRAAALWSCSEPSSWC